MVQRGIHGPAAAGCGALAWGGSDGEWLGSIRQRRVSQHVDGKLAGHPVLRQQATVAPSRPSSFHSYLKLFTFEETFHLQAIPAFDALTTLSVESPLGLAHCAISPSF